MASRFMTHGSFRRAATRTRQVLLEETGAGLVDAMVGALVFAVMATAVGSMMITVSVGVDTLRNNNERAAYIRDLGQEPLGNILNLPTEPASTTEVIDGEDLKVTRWKKETPGLVTAYATVSKLNQGLEANCTTVESLINDRCLSSSVTRKTVSPGLKPVPAEWVEWTDDYMNGPAPATNEILATYRDTTVKELRWYGEFTCITGPCRVEFISDGGGVESTVDVTAGGSFNGTLPDNITDGSSTARVMFHGDGTAGNMRLYKGPAL